MLLEVTIDLGKGREGVFKIYSGEDVEEVVDGFCSRYSLGNAVKLKIIEQVRTKLADESMQSIRLKKSPDECSSSANITDENEDVNELSFVYDSKCMANHSEDKASNQEFESNGKQIPEDFTCSTKEEKKTPSRNARERPKTPLPKTTELHKKQMAIIETKDMIQRLIKYGAKKRVKKDRLSSKSFYVNASECTFTPSINKKYFSI